MSVIPLFGLGSVSLFVLFLYVCPLGLHLVSVGVFPFLVCLFCRFCDSRYVFEVYSVACVANFACFVCLVYGVILCFFLRFCVCTWYRVFLQSFWLFFNWFF